MKKIGAYLPGAYEEVVDVMDAYVLTLFMGQEFVNFGNLKIIF